MLIFLHLYFFFAILILLLFFFLAIWDIACHRLDRLTSGLLILAKCVGIRVDNKRALRIGIVSDF